jgi:hypothetical protein
MVRSLPDAFCGRSDEEDISNDVASAASTTMTQRARILESLCRMAAEQTAQHPDPQRVLDWQDPLPEASEELLARLREQHHRA